MIIATHEVRLRPRRYTGEEPAGLLELEHDPLLRTDGPVRYALVAQRLGDELLVRGALAAPLRCRCARCGAWYAHTARDKGFARAYPLTADNQAIDLTADIREAMLLVLPVHGVCRPDCNGLCAHCGADLNRAPCACRGRAPGAAWTALDGLTLT